MMFSEDKNVLLYNTTKQLLDASKKEDKKLNFTSIEDFDGVSYLVHYRVDNQPHLKLHIRSPCFGDLYANGAKEALDKAFPGMVTPNQDGYDISVILDLDQLPQIPSKPKNASAEEKDAFKAEKQRLSDERDKVVEDWATKFARIKVILYGAPIERALANLVDGKLDKSHGAVIPFREGEKFWVIPSDDRVTVIYGVSLKDHTDKTLSRVFMVEFEEARRHVRNSASIKFHEKKIPVELEAFNVTEKFSVGFLSITMQKAHASPVDKTTFWVSSFRQYLHYHLHASKTYLHTRMRKRVESLLKVLNRAIPPKEEKKYKGQKVEEKKVVESMSQLKRG